MNLSEVMKEIATIRPSTSAPTVFSVIGADVAQRVGIADVSVRRYLNGRLSAELTDEIRVYVEDLSKDGLLFLLNSILWWAAKGKLWPLFNMVDHCFQMEARIQEVSALHRVCNEQGVSNLVIEIARCLLRDIAIGGYQGPELELKMSECIEVVVAARDIWRYESLTNQ